MKIGLLPLENITVFAPLAGITNLPLRLMAKAEGCGLVCSEMISAKGLIHNHEKTKALLASHPDEKPLSVQIFGAEPLVMAEAAKIVEASGADILDINFGCSVKKVIKTGSGVALMKEPLLAGEMLKAVRKAIRIPLTIKIRSGWDHSGDQALMIAKIAEEAGVDAITVHPRSAKQGFSGHSDWTLIKRIRDLIKIPVIGNGDILSAQDALAMMEETGCHAVMVGRAAFGNPWIFSEIIALMEGRENPAVGIQKRFDTMTHYLEASIQHLGEKQACYLMRSRLGWFAKGLPHSAKFREASKAIGSRTLGLQLIDEYRAMVEIENQGV
ncbi:MAG: tRNA dihydrouridine synthase DusB [Proteobacteria bacterium]|nr:tRNA dihydrouridine synthase DusB [Pseudomonadota bacterium]